MILLPYTCTLMQVRFSDLDMIGHVSNSNYASYFDMGRIDFFKEVEKMSTVKRPHHVVASVKMDMLREIRFDHKVEIATWCSRVGTKSMTIEHLIFADGEIATTSQSVLVGFDLKTRRSTPFPTDWAPTDPALIPVVPGR
ncbi:acyl-CoA thioesterase [Spongiibacter sp. KMU-166]|uniref:Acyl-CoA thioesterase n=1 Tax=Spongiibacter thalassae TaxID=2721624 RepID=A0ABX1GG41_9GAMM|nr:acyl-CoA thioesterase [Spongiibacter thalassae]